MISWIAMDNMVTAHGKDHVRLRRLVGKAFTARRTELRRPRVVELTNQLLDATHPEQLELVRAGTNTWADVIDETLRVQSPLAHLPLRYAVEDIPLDDGVVIPQRDRGRRRCS